MGSFLNEKGDEMVFLVRGDTTLAALPSSHPASGRIEFYFKLFGC